MKVIICNKREFNRFMEYNGITDDNVETKDMMFISVNHAISNVDFVHDTSKVQSYFKRQHPNVHIMHFGDYGENYVYKFIHEGPTGLFNEYKAKKLYEFIKANKDKSIAIVHCAAGISRSGAVGTFIYDLYGHVDFTEFKRTNPRIQPNQHVLKLLRKEQEKDERNRSHS